MLPRSMTSTDSTHLQHLEQSSPLKDALHASEAFLLAGLTQDGSTKVTHPFSLVLVPKHDFHSQEICPQGWRIHTTLDRSFCLVLDSPDVLVGCA